jgi:hypothetical protein
VKLRLLLFEECDRSCAGCCNLGFALEALDVCEDWDGYDEIILTGGEPMLRPDYVKGVIDAIRVQVDTPIYMYTAKTSNPLAVLEILEMIQGITVTLHEQADVGDFCWLLACIKRADVRDKSLRLNVFSGVDVKGLDLSGWKVKDNIEWIPDCPLPEDERFMRLAPTS